MSAMLGAALFFGAAVFALVVITEMMWAYMPTMKAALRGAPLPRTEAPRAYATRRPARRMAGAFTPLRIERARAAA